MPPSFKVAIVGYGLSATVFHIPFIQSHSQLQLQAIVQRKASTSSNAAVDFPDAQHFNSTDDLFVQSNFDVVVICTPPWTHYALAKQAIEHKKHVVIEKPMTPTAKEADELIAAAEANHVLLTVYQNRRWDNDFLTIRKLVEEARLGSIVEFESHFDRFCPGETPGAIGTAQPGTGILYDLGVHLIDQVYVLWGMPQRVTTFVDSLKHAESKDTFTVLLHYPGRLVTVKATTHSAEEAQLRYWVRGDRGSFKKFHLDIQEPQLAAGQLPTEQGFGIEPVSRFGILTVADGHKGLVSAPHANVAPQLYSAFYDRLVQSLLSGDLTKAVPVDPAEVRDVLHLIEKSLESAERYITIDI